MKRFSSTLLGPGVLAMVALLGGTTVAGPAVAPEGSGHTARLAPLAADTPVVPQTARRGGRLRHKKVDFSISCNECHREETPEVYAEWEASMHGDANVGCFVCHGDGEEEFHSVPSDESCLSCHSERMVEVERLPADGCFACHTGHRLTFHTH